MPPVLTLRAIEARLAPHQLAVLGGFHAEETEQGAAEQVAAGRGLALPKGCKTLLMLGPQQPGFWPHLCASPEWQDGKSDPVDRWSRRVIGRLACDLGGKALFPFGGPPYYPFHAWALRTGRVWDSPIRLLVHDDQGLWVSFRGALALRQHIDLPPFPPQPAPSRPCTHCAAPCVSACPVGALGPEGYDVPRCHAYLDTTAGEKCLSEGCQARAACPVSVRHARMQEQSAYHMRQFHR